MILRIFIFLLFGGCAALSQTNKYTGLMFRHALQNTTTSPSYVLISIADNASHSNRMVCIQAPFLLGAIHIENHLGYDEAGEQKAMKIALGQPGRFFIFTNPKATRNIQPLYDKKILIEVRGQLAAKTEAQLRNEMKIPDGAIYQMYYKTMASDAYRDAVAHVLLERGIQVNRGDVNGALYIF